MEDVIPSSCDFLKNISFTNLDDDFEKNFFLDWDEINEEELKALSQTLEEMITIDENIVTNTLTTLSATVNETLATAVKEEDVLNPFLPIQSGSEEEEGEEEEEEEDEEDDGAWLPLDPSHYETLTKEEAQHCYNVLKANTEYYGKTFLLEKYKENKENGVVPAILKSTLNECQYIETADCFNCHERIYTTYLKNPSRCLYHVLCRECFIFTQSMLLYKWGNNPIECPLQKLKQRCRLVRMKLAEERYQKTKHAKLEFNS
jgi:hypothetical protein